MASVYLFINNAIANFLASVLAVILFLVCFDVSWKDKLLAGGFYILFGVGAELTTVVMISILSRISPMASLAPGFQQNIGLVISKLLLFLVLQVLLHARRKHTHESMPFIYWLSVFAFPIGSIIIIFSISILTLTMEKMESMRLVAISSVMLMALNGLVFILYNQLEAGYMKQQQNAILEERIVFYKNQVDQAASNEKSIQVLRHDLKNHIAVLVELAKEKKNEDIITYGEQLIGDTSNAATLIHSGNHVVDTLLNYKLGIAQQYDIQLNTTIHTSSAIEISDNDFCSLLGNMLDNAVEACLKIPDNRFISLSISSRYNTLYISMSNPYVGVIRHDRTGYVSTKADKMQHGYGMKSIAAVVKKYHGTLQIQKDNGTFCMQAILFSQTTETPVSDPSPPAFERSDST